MLVRASPLLTCLGGLGMFLQTLTNNAIPNEFGRAVLFLLKEYWPLFKEGLRYTIVIALTGTLIGLLLAIIITPIKIQKVSKRDSSLVAAVKYIGIFLSSFYVEVLRGTPMMVQAVIIYYGLAGIGVDLTINFFHLFVIPGIIVTGIAIVSINTSAYIIEVLRGSINAIDKGQMEAARSIGMTRWQAMRKIIIPQALKNSVPAIGNEFVINIKDTSVLSVIAVTELFYMTRKVNSIYFRQTEGFVIAAIFYLLMTFTITRLLYLISSRMGVKSESYPTSQSFIKKVFTKWK
jgi:putative lysine transport system permease protein